jgi:serine/threonine-protein kinase SRK2
MAFLACLPLFKPPTFSMQAQFQTLKRLGRGMEGEVWLCRDVKTEELVAIKLIPRGAPAWQMAMVEHEISIMLELGACHPNIVHPRELVLTPTHLGLVQEYMSGGTLGQYLKQHKVDEAVACYFFRQLIAAVEYCHRHRIAYRDIKLENTLLDRSSPPRVVACDFGAAKQWKRKEMPVMYSITGAPLARAAAMLAPEAARPRPPARRLPPAAAQQLRA